MDNRYNRQIILPNFGEKSQEKLAVAKVLVVGAGGLGSSVLQFLARSGVGYLGMVDFDVVDLSNIHRQVLYTEASVGKDKVEQAEEQVLKINSTTKTTTYNECLNIDNALDIVPLYDIIVDCTDSIEMRFFLSDVCSILDKPLVYGSVFHYEGQVSVFNIGDEESRKNYRDLFNKSESNIQIAGVLGTLVGIVGTIQANEVIKIITEIGEVLAGRLMLINMLDYDIKILKYKALKSNNTPKSIAELKSMYEKE